MQKGKAKRHTRTLLLHVQKTSRAWWETNLYIELELSNLVTCLNSQWILKSHVKFFILLFLFNKLWMAYSRALLFWVKTTSILVPVNKETEQSQDSSLQRPAFPKPCIGFPTFHYSLQKAENCTTNHCITSALLLLLGGTISACLASKVLF